MREGVFVVQGIAVSATGLKAHESTRTWQAGHCARVYIVGCGPNCDSNHFSDAVAIPFLAEIKQRKYNKENQMPNSVGRTLFRDQKQVSDFVMVDTSTKMSRFWLSRQPNFLLRL
jgi:hypothetical protein